MPDTLATLADEYWDGVLARHSFTATTYGDHRFDAVVPDHSPAGLADERSFVVGIERRGSAIDDGELSTSERVTRWLLIDACRTRAEAIDLDEIQLQSDGFTGFPISLLRSASSREAPDPASAHAQLERLRGLPRVLDEVIEHWRIGAARGRTPASTSVRRSRAMVDAHLAQPVADDPFVLLMLPDGWDGAEDWQSAATTVVTDLVRPAYRRVADALADLERDGRDDDHPGLCQIPGGDELYASLVRRATTTDLDPARIHQIGMDELTQKLPREWAEVGAGALGVSDTDELFARLRSDPSLKYDSAAEILELATEAISRAAATAPEWFAHLPTTGCVAEAIPESLAPGSPPADHSAPPADGSRSGVYFANTYEATRRNRFEAEVFAFHEAIPGHHLERASAVELDVPMFQRRGGYMAYSEGWGLYTERLADEMGLYSSDLMRLGMLSADAWRSTRLVVDTGLHALGWTRDRALEFMLAHVPIDPSEAAVEIDRYIGMPAEALSYKVGQREMFRIRGDAEDRLGEAFDIRDFHTAVLEHGGVPLGVLADLIDAWVDRVAAGNAA